MICEHCKGDIAPGTLCVNEPDQAPMEPFDVRTRPMWRPGEKLGHIDTVNHYFHQDCWEQMDEKRKGLRADLAAHGYDYDRLLADWEARDGPEQAKELIELFRVMLNLPVPPELQREVAPGSPAWQFAEVQRHAAAKEAWLKAQSALLASQTYSVDAAVD